MTAAAILKEVRKLLGDSLSNVGIEDFPEFTAKQILEGLESAAWFMEVAELGDFVYTVDVAAETISPEPTTMDGLLLAAKTAADILKTDTSKKLRHGAYGVRFRTALNEISTVEASKHISQEAKSLQEHFERLKMLKLSRRGTSQRVQ